MNIFDAYSYITGSSDSGTYDRLGFDARERRLSEERDAVAAPAPLEASERSIRCFHCGLPLDIARVDGTAWQFNHGTTTLHRCRYRRPRR